MLSRGLPLSVQELSHSSILSSRQRWAPVENVTNRHAHARVRRMLPATVEKTGVDQSGLGR